ncbi:MAG: GNAT family N-acetyltransferase [Blastocatellia bacterium]|nr:GNAT family N-acetyltransferase [Blastocatellia bacterium]
MTATMGPSDVDACWQLDQRCFEGSEAYERQTIHDLLSSPDTLCFKTVAPDDELAGFAIGVVEPKFRGHVVVLGVSPDYRRRGVATELMRQLSRTRSATGRSIHAPRSSHDQRWSPRTLRRTRFPRRRSSPWLLHERR